jgi:quercetin dioxygenase-like cupin family protein
MFKVLNVFEVVQSSGKLPIKIPGVDAHGESLFSNGKLGVDMIQLAPHQAFPLHTHPADHLLFIVAGEGTVTVGAQVYQTRPGDLYMIHGTVEHAVGAGAEGQYLLSFGAPHYHLDHPERMKIIE